LAQRNAVADLQARKLARQRRRERDFSRLGVGFVDANDAVASLVASITS